MNQGTEAKMVARRLRLLNSAQKDCLAARLGVRGGVARASLMSARILRLAQQQPGGRLLGLVVRAAHMQPVGAFDDEEAADRDDQARG